MPDLTALLGAIAEIPVTLQADLETGSHHLNNVASEQFARRYRWLTQQLRLVGQLASQIEEETT